jgi:L-amino acid N-acyltransferase YncA
MWTNITLKLPIDVEFFHCGITITDDAGQVRAACVVYDNPALQWEGRPAACFGHFECANDPEAVRRLIEAAAQQARSLGKTALLGPMNGSTWDDYRVAVNGFETTYLLDVQHPPYYADLLRQAGMTVAAHYTTAKTADLTADPVHVPAAQQALEVRGLTIRQIDLDAYEAELASIYAFCMRVFAHNFLFTPISWEHFYAKYEPLRAFIRPEYVLLCTEASGALCGFVFAIPNYADTVGKGLIVKTIARSPEPEFRGVATMTATILRERAQADGFQYMLYAFMEQHNRSVGISEYFKGNIIKNYQLFGLLL